MRYLLQTYKSEPKMFRFKMFFTLKILLIMGIFRTMCDSKMTSQYKDTCSIATYKGESFPKKYLIPEETIPTAVDLENYISKLEKTVNYIYRDIKLKNDTDVNNAVGMFFMKAILKRAILDYKEKLTKSNYGILKEIIRKSEDFMSIYVYVMKYLYRDNDLEYRLSVLMKEDSTHVYSIGEFTKGRLGKWIMSDTTMHPFVEEMDDLTLPKEDYVHMTEDLDSFFFSIDDSDMCVSRVVLRPEPINLSELQPCRLDSFCKEWVFTKPSASYALSHRLLMVLLLRHNRRCYVLSEREDDDFIDTHCAFMYREAVYLARRGFFARDMFLEHAKDLYRNLQQQYISHCAFMYHEAVSLARRGFFARDMFLEHVALCGLLGYEEFFRHQWFRKSVSWMDDQGCISESRNFLINQSRSYTQKDVNNQRRLVKRLKISLLEDCHSHPMALLLVVISHAIRHTLNFL